MAKQNLKGALVLVQSGGPSSVINASAQGLFDIALKHKSVITKVYGARFGILGFLKEDLVLINEEKREELDKLQYTPSSMIGSTRYKLKQPNEDITDYEKVIEICKKYDIRYFFYNGGNDSMDTANKLSQYLNDQGWEIRVMGIPKTVDNDLVLTDHTPGYGSASKYVASTLMELCLDTKAYNMDQVNIVEIMGRNAGWLTAASDLARRTGFGPDLIYLPEYPFDYNEFLSRVKDILQEKGSVLVTISEGLKTTDGKYLPEYFGASLYKDAFGHSQLGGAANSLANALKKDLKVKVRPIELNIMQRAAAHIASFTDIKEAYAVSEFAFKEALNGKTGYMAGFTRTCDNPYKIKYELFPLSRVANHEKMLPKEWILPNHNGMTDEFYNYVMPLIQGETKLKYKNGLPDFANLKLNIIKK